MEKRCPRHFEDLLGNTFTSLGSLLYLEAIILLISFEVNSGWNPWMLISGIFCVFFCSAMPILEVRLHSLLAYSFE